MSQTDANSKYEQMLQINEFVAKSSGLKSKLSDSKKLHISQTADGKNIAFPIAELEEVISRIDSDGHVFLQVNFVGPHEPMSTTPSPTYGREAGNRTGSARKTRQR